METEFKMKNQKKADPKLCRIEDPDCEACQ